MTKHTHILPILGLLTISLLSCENRDVNYSDGPNFSEIHEDIEYHFDQVTIEGHEYYILERDRNNPHEGFGFMAMKANKTIGNLDTIKAYLKTLVDIQVETLAAKTGQSIEESEASVNKLFEFHLKNSQSLLPTQKKGADE
ncbi:hypothetical protein N7E81_14415 [Reichenbachiella carrageenanivorans]|uniref:Uncharacterized protein n=1 Tax=Reichenbachiella carrageenanivorans TaxID=2979869 RepID=A0ABY6CXA3_9BACT|nr:hypothetical protein [Reichenbachiella carrageenanivorans]UXX78551.1 hypothetical protein N7E81_14415 [Reichenbachiella carrageenanivorans]